MRNPSVVQDGGTTAPPPSPNSWCLKAEPSPTPPLLMRRAAVWHCAPPPLPPLGIKAQHWKFASSHQSRTSSPLWLLQKRKKEELFTTDFFFLSLSLFVSFLLETFTFHSGKTEITHASRSDVPFFCFLLYRNKQMVSKMLKKTNKKKQKVAYVMFRTKLYTMKLYMSVDTVYI